MAETLRDLVVSLSLQTDNFTRNIKSVNKQIAEAESQFKLAASGVEGFERSATGLAAQLSTLERRLSLQKDAVTPRAHRRQRQAAGVLFPPERLRPAPDRCKNRTAGAQGTGGRSGTAGQNLFGHTWRE